MKIPYDPFRNRLNRAFTQQTKACWMRCIFTHKYIVETKLANVSISVSKMSIKIWNSFWWGSVHQYWWKASNAFGSKCWNLKIPLSDTLCAWNIWKEKCKVKSQSFTHLHHHQVQDVNDWGNYSVRWLVPRVLLLWIICGKFNTISFWFTPLASRKAGLIADNQKLINCWVAEVSFNEPYD